MTKIIQIKSCNQCHYSMYDIEYKLYCSKLTFIEKKYVDNKLGIREDCPLEDYKGDKNAGY